MTNRSKTITGFIAVGAATLSMSTVGLAAKGGNGGGKNQQGAVTVDVADGTFGGTTTASLMSAPDTLAIAMTGEESWLRAECYQNGQMVYAQYEKTTAGSASFTLGPTPSWSGGQADCVAAEVYKRGGRWAVGASTPFITWAD